MRRSRRRWQRLRAWGSPTVRRICDCWRRTETTLRPRSMPCWANFIYTMTGRGARAQPTLNVQLSALQAGVVFAGRYLLCLRDFFCGSCDGAAWSVLFWGPGWFSFVRTYRFLLLEE